MGDFTIVSARLVEEVHDTRAPQGESFLLIGLAKPNLEKLVAGEFPLETFQSKIQQDQNGIYVLGSDGSQTFYTSMGGWIEDDFVIGFRVPVGDSFTLYWTGNDPIPYLKSPTSHNRQQLELSLLRKLNQRHLDRRDHDSELTGRMSTFKAASGLQRQAPEALDLSRESKSTLELYGAAQGDQASYAAQCIMARRLIERGVRFVEIIDAVGACRDNWDAAHRDMASHEKYARRVDQPIAALITDLKQRGLFEETLLVFCTEFGRSPWAQDGKGTKSRTHHPNAFSCWLAGGNVRGGVIHGESDDIGNYVVKDLVHIHDFHATILHIMGLNHEQLTYRHAGRDFRLTDVHGHVVKQILHS